MLNVSNACNMGLRSLCYSGSMVVYSINSVSKSDRAGIEVKLGYNGYRLNYFKQLGFNKGLAGADYG